MQEPAVSFAQKLIVGCYSQLQAENKSWDLLIAPKVKKKLICLLEKPIGLQTLTKVKWIITVLFTILSASRTLILRKKNMFFNPWYRNTKVLWSENPNHKFSNILLLVVLCKVQKFAKQNILRWKYSFKFSKTSRLQRLLRDGGSAVKKFCRIFKINLPAFAWANIFEIRE